MTDESNLPYEPEPEPAEQEAPLPSEPAVPSSTGIAWGAILLVIAIALIVIFSVQNTDSVPVRFLWMEGEFSLAIIILVTVGVIIVLTELAGLSYRRRRRRRRAEREELKRLRDS